MAGVDSLKGKATGQSTLSGVLTPGAVPGEKREKMRYTERNIRAAMVKLYKARKGDTVTIAGARISVMGDGIRRVGYGSNPHLTLFVEDKDKGLPVTILSERIGQGLKLQAITEVRHGVYTLRIKAGTGAVDLAETLKAESKAPSYTCPRCHRGCMKSTGSDGDWHQMECPDCGHQEEREAS